jgi:hypothetical protein
MSRSEKLAGNLANRKWLASRLRAEIVGPDPAGTECDLHPGGEQKRFTREEFYKPKKQANGEEVIWQDPPAKTYGAGVLFPIGVIEEREQLRAGEDQEDQQSSVEIDPGENQDVDEKLERRAERKAAKIPAAMDESEDYAVTLANAFRPSAIGLSFLADFSVEGLGLRVEVVSVGRLGSDDIREIPVGTYKKTKVIVGDPGGVPFPKSVWLRVPLRDDANGLPYVEISSAELLASRGAIIKKLAGVGQGLEIVVVSRGGYSRLTSTQRLITVSLVNRKELDAGNLDEQCLFQAGIRVKGQTGSPWIQPYPESEVSKLGVQDPMSDEQINRLIYRQHQTFAIGHGCAADWAGQSPESVAEVWTDVMPAFETPTTSADLFVWNKDGSRQPIKVSMRKLAGLDPEDDGAAEIDALVQSYKSWINDLKTEREGVPSISADMKETSEVLIKRCEECLERIEDGVKFLQENTTLACAAKEAFVLANRAMLIAQLRSTREVRVPSLGSDGKSIIWSPAISDIDPSIPDPQGRGYWRAFQIAFLLMSLRGIADPEGKDREIVDLIWFPTGGGKTEAYLGLTAFTILFNRLSGRNSGGADVLMRYTLRLLTAQQFQRAAILFCAMEQIRNKIPKLGEKPFRIGLWVGGTTSPNTREEALQALQSLQRDPGSENPFILLKCPWCGAKFGASSSEGAHRQRGGPRGRSFHAKETGIPSVLGYSKYTRTNDALPTVVFRCNDSACDFGTASTMQKSRPPLPIVIIDEDLIENPPSLVIGTVDKFAMLAWKPGVRRLFGIGSNGKHEGMPPSLIIQDELHLISGPLGSMVGAYETVIERLCRKDGYGHIKPKIIASTATISRAREQISHLYARDNVFLFPPSGLEAGDSFFARDARNDDGTPEPGRLYLGVLASAHGSFQTTQARVYACLMQHAVIMNTDEAGRDPWWTLLCFFNSLRELGGAASLFVADARDYLKVILDRQGIKYEKIRKLFNVSELTSRIRGDQVPKELERLERTLRVQTDKNKSATNDDYDVVDACLASSIIEVGVDVSRLALMVIVGQPKTTSQYIQVSSRVGRDPEKPGLVAVLYGQSKPRDRSHFERFRPYHQRLYAQVEPTSVTPFSAPAVERSLHGIIVAAVRQLGVLDAESSSPDPFPLGESSSLRNLIEEMIEERVLAVAPKERDAVMEKLQLRLEQWRKWQPGEYGGFGAAPQDPPLLYPAGSTVPPNWDGHSWPTMSSLRNVDASCEAEITRFFNKLQDEQI